LSGSTGRAPHRFGPYRTPHVRCRCALTLIELLTAMAVTTLLVVTLATFAEAVSMMWHEGEELAQTNQQARVALTHLRREIGQALYVTTPGSQTDTLVLWAHDDKAPHGEMNLSEIVIICAAYDQNRGTARLVRIAQNPPGFWDFSYDADQIPQKLNDWSLISLLKQWWYARPATLAQNLVYDTSSVQFAVRTTPSRTAYDLSALDRFVDFQLHVELNPLEGAGAGAANRELMTIDGSAQAKNYQRWLDAS
jgi:hypothetical protein